MKNKNILFRADSSSSIGTGHIMRDLVLASRYKNANIIFATQDLVGNINHKIVEAGYKVEILKSNDIKEVTKLIKKHSIDMIVIDHYDIDEKQEKKLKTKNKDLEILCFDDTYERHYCDILLNHNIYGDKNRYKGLVPKNCELRCGSKYTLIREEFIEKRNNKKIVEKNNTIFVAMGGADSQNMNIEILERLLKFSFKINIVTTSANKNLLELKTYVDIHKNINLYVDNENIAQIISNSTIAIVTPSVIVNEVSFMKIPFIAILVVENQHEMFEYLISQRLFAVKKNDLRKFDFYMMELLDSDTYKKQLKIVSRLFKNRED